MTTFLPLLMYMPFFVGLPESRRPLRSNQSPIDIAPVWVSSLPMAVVEPSPPTMRTMMYCGRLVAALRLGGI